MNGSHLDHVRASSAEDVAELSGLLHDGWIDLSSVHWSYRKSLWQAAVEPFEADAEGGMKSPSLYSFVLTVRGATAWNHWGDRTVDSIDDIDCSARYVTIACHIDLLLRVEVEALDLEVRRAVPPYQHRL
jgi:hypothetical protein